MGEEAGTTTESYYAIICGANARFPSDGSVGAMSPCGGRAVRYRICLLAVVTVVGSAAVARAQGGPDEPSLKLAHETLIRSVTSGNLTVTQAMIHPRASGFFQESQRPVQLGQDVRAADILPTLIADLGHFDSTPTDTAYRVIGSVGMVNMTAFMQAKKGERQPDRYVRGSYVYSWEGGNWKLVAWHGSDTPLKK